MKIIMDLDGVLADFVWSFTTLIHAAYPKVTPRHTKDHKSGWSFEDIPAEAKKKAWGRWHERLAELDDGRILFGAMGFEGIERGAPGT